MSVHKHSQALPIPPEYSLIARGTRDHGGMSTDKHFGELMSVNEHWSNKSPKGFENSWALMSSAGQFGGKNYLHTAFQCA